MNFPAVLALSGGVGGAKLALGLSHLLAAEQLTIVANTADDFEHLGLPISPDLDTVMYTLAGRNNAEQGWGLAGESWQAMAMLGDYGGADWFQLGDRDIATHLVRGERLRGGDTLSEVTAYLCQRLGIAATVLPMTDDAVRTKILTADGELDFQHYFVREACRPSVSGFRFEGVANARPQADFMAALGSSQLEALVICPSNPFVSVQPILELAGVRAAMAAASAPVIAVSPIVAGQAIKGPAAKMMAELQMPATALAVAEYYAELVDGFVIDEADRDQADAIRALGLAVKVVPTVMKSLQNRIELARQVLAFARDCQAGLESR